MVAALEIERQAARPTPKFDGGGSFCSDLPSLQRYRQDVIGGCRHPRALATVLSWLSVSSRRLANNGSSGDEWSGGTRSGGVCSSGGCNGAEHGGDWGGGGGGGSRSGSGQSYGGGGRRHGLGTAAAQAAELEHDDQEAEGALEKAAGWEAEVVARQETRRGLKHSLDTRMLFTSAEKTNSRTALGSGNLTLPLYGGTQS